MATKKGRKRIATIDQANSDFNDYLSQKSRKSSTKKKKKRTK